MIDSAPVIPALIVAFLASVAYFLLELRASKRYWAARDASNPVVVTGSGIRSNRYPRSCGGVR